MKSKGAFFVSSNQLLSDLDTNFCCKYLLIYQHKQMEKGKKKKKKVGTLDC